MDVILVVPPALEAGLEMAPKESSGVAFLAAVLRQTGYKVRILDACLLRLNEAQLIKMIREEESKVIGISTLEQAFASVARIVEELRRQGVKSHITLGGYFPTFVAKELFGTGLAIDSVILGEGEYTFLELVQRLFEEKDWQDIKGLAYKDNGEVKINQYRLAIDNLDLLPFQARDTLTYLLSKGGSATIVSSRGCYHNCAFCSINVFAKVNPGQVWRCRSPENTVEEIEFLHRRYGVRSFIFVDNLFMGPGQAGRERAYLIAQEIKKRQLRIEFGIYCRANETERESLSYLKEAGLTEVYIGVESMSQRMLDFLRKGTTVEENRQALETLDDLGLHYRLGFIMYGPRSNLEEIRENIHFLRNLIQSRYCEKLHFSNSLRIYRGSPLEDILRKEGILIKAGLHCVYQFQDPKVIELMRLSKEIVSRIIPLRKAAKRLAKSPGEWKTMDRLISNWNLNVCEGLIDNLEKGEIDQEKKQAIISRADKAMEEIEEKIGLNTVKDTLF